MREEVLEPISKTLASETLKLVKIQNNLRYSDPLEMSAVDYRGTLDFDNEFNEVDIVI